MGETNDTKETKSGSKIEIPKEMLIVGVVAVIIGAIFSFGAAQIYFVATQGQTPVGTQTNITALSQKVAQYIDDNFLAPYGVRCKITNWTEYENIVNFSVEVELQGQKSTTNVYVTKDGKFMLLGSLFDLSKPLPKLEPQAGPQQQNYPKSERPEVLLFVMSFCPYAQQAERGMFPVLRLLGDKINFSLHFVIYSPEYYGNDPKYCLDGLCSMHGVDALKEDIRQMCIMKYYPNKWMEYIEGINANCNRRDVATCWKTIAEQLGIDVAKVENCLAGEGLDMARADKALGEQYGVQGSPTMFINSIEYRGGRASEDYKQAICSAFITPPPECEQTLSTVSAQASGTCG